MPAIPRKPPRVAGLDPDPRHAPFRVLAVGDPGSGKSTIGKKILVDVLARRDMAVVLDIGGDMLDVLPGEGAARHADLQPRRLRRGRRRAERGRAAGDRDRPPAVRREAPPRRQGGSQSVLHQARQERLQVPPGHPGPLCAGQLHARGPDPPRAEHGGSPGSSAAGSPASATPGAPSRTKTRGATSTPRCCRPSSRSRSRRPSGTPRRGRSRSWTSSAAARAS